MAIKEIGGRRFHVEPLPAMRSFRLQARLAPALAEVAGVIGTLQGGGAEVEAIAPAAARFFGKLPPDELEGVTRELLATCRIEQNGSLVDLLAVFDVVMQGRTLEVWSLLWFALGVHYPDFFGRLGALRAASPKAAENPSAT